VLPSTCGSSRRRRAGAGGLLSAEPGYARRASAGPARPQAGAAAPAGGPQPGQPGAIGQQLGDPAGAWNGDDRPDPAAGQRQPLPRPARRGIARHATHGHHPPPARRSSAPGPDGTRGASQAPARSMRTSTCACPIMHERACPSGTVMNNHATRVGQAAVGPSLVLAAGVVVVGPVSVVVRMVLGGGSALTGRFGRHSTARLAVVAAARLALAQLDERVGRSHPQLGNEGGVVGDPVGHQGPPT
jgi:hypothetical protein